MRLTFLNRFYWPEEPATAQLLTDMAEQMAARGWTVSVITSRPRTSPVPAVERRNGVLVRRVAATKLGNRHALLQACDFVTFAISALLRLVVDARRGDVVVVMTDPPLLGIFATAIARLRGARVVHWIQDIYPETAVLVTGKRWLGFLRVPRNLAWRAADAVVVLGEDMAVAPRGAGVPAHKLEIIPNWAPEGIRILPAPEVDRLRQEWALEGKFVVGYFGNLGRVHDLEAVLALAERLRSEGDFRFVFIGPGAQRIRLEASARRRGLANVQFHAAQPREHRSEMLALGHVHLVTLVEGGERVVFPSKLYGICAAARPVLYIGPLGCEIAATITKHSLGCAFSRDNLDAAAEALRALRDSSARVRELESAAYRFYQTEGSVVHAAPRWDALLRRVASPPERVALASTTG